jgi:hypothetical protein
LYNGAVLPQLLSIMITFPPGRKTLFHSAIAFSGSGSDQTTCLLMTTSKELSLKGNTSASPTRNSTARFSFFAFSLAFCTICSAISTPVTLCPNSARSSAMTPVPVPTSRISSLLSPSTPFKRPIQASFSLAV